MSANGHALTTWKTGDQLRAPDLNGNFLVLYEMVIEALAASRMPDPANVALEMKTGRLAQRVEGLEKLTSLQAHQRNEPQYVPLSYLGSMITMVNDLRQEVEKAILRIDQLHASLGADHDDLHARLARVEQYPDAASEEEFSVLSREYKGTAVDLRRACAEIVELRHEVKTLTDWMTGTNQRVNRVEYAPLAYFAEVLKRIEALEARNA